MRFRLRTLMIACAMVAAVSAVMASGLFVFGVIPTSSGIPTTQESQALVNIQDIEPYGARVAQTPQREVWKKRTYFNGSLKLDYIYDPQLAAGPRDDVYLRSTVHLEPTEDDARTSFEVTVNSFESGVRLGGADLRKLSHKMATADESYFGALESGGGTRVANVVVVRQGQLVHVLQTTSRITDPRLLEGIPRYRIRAASGLKAR